MDANNLSARKMRILKAIVDAHITNGEPVGSKYLAEEVGIACSSATIRNEMAELESLGYLEQPYTSSGRIPSELGYRFYVDSLVRQYSDTKLEIDEINERLRYKLTEMDGILEEASKLAASFTDYTGIAFKTGIGQVRISKFESVYLGPRDFLFVMIFSGDIVKAKSVHLGFSITAADLTRFTEAANMYLSNITSEAISMPVIVKLEAIMGPAAAMVHPTIKLIYETMNELEEADVKLDGINKLLQYPEHFEGAKLQRLVGMLEEKEKLLDVIASHKSSDEGINVYIGRENDSDIMSNTTLIFKNVTVRGKRVSVGVIGPKRMNYSKVIGMLNQLATGLDRMFSDDDDIGKLPEGKSF